MTKPVLTPEPTYTYAEIAEAYSVSYSSVVRAVADGSLKAARQGRCKKASRSDIDAWWSTRHEREADRRAGRTTRRDQRGIEPRKTKAKSTYVPKADRDVLETLGLEAA